MDHTLPEVDEEFVSIECVDLIYTSHIINVKMRYPEDIQMEIKPKKYVNIDRDYYEVEFCYYDKKLHQILNKVFYFLNEEKAKGLYDQFEHRNMLTRNERDRYLSKLLTLFLCNFPIILSRN